MTKRQSFPLKQTQLKTARAVQKLTLSAEGILAAVENGDMAEDITMHEAVSGCIVGHEGLQQLITEGNQLVDLFKEGGEGGEGREKVSEGNNVVDGGAAPALLFDKGAIAESKVSDIKDLTNFLKKK